MEVERIEDTGVLLALVLVTNDAYGGFTFAGQGADLSTFSVATAYPQDFYDTGSFLQDPSGWIEQYYRPNPQSTAGLYYVVVNSEGFQGSSVPYVPTTIVKLTLLSDSTQAEAVISVACLRMIITNKKQFIRSLRAVLGMPIIQDIDPALLIAGLQEITQKGEFDKKKKEGEE